MAEPVKISTSKHIKEGKVDIDGHIWTVKLPGAKTELRMSQVFRDNKLYAARIANLDKKIDSDKYTDEDLDKYEEYNNKFKESEQEVFDFFQTIFKDETEDNSEVKEWVANTPTAIIQLAFEDIKEQTNNKGSGDGGNGQTEPSSSS